MPFSLENILRDYPHITLASEADNDDFLCKASGQSLFAVVLSKDYTANDSLSK